MDFFVDSVLGLIALVSRDILANDEVGFCSGRQHTSRLFGLAGMHAASTRPSHVLIQIDGFAARPADHSRYLCQGHGLLEESNASIQKYGVVATRME